MTTVQVDDCDAVLEQPRTRVLLATDGAAASLDAARTIRDNLRAIGRSSRSGCS